MTRLTLAVTVTLLTSGAFVQAQEMSALITENKQTYDAVKANLIKAVEKMPDDGYSFKPTPDIRTFAALMAHIADSQTRNCSAVMGQMKPAEAASKTSKADLVAAMKESVATCDSAWESLTPASALQMIKWRNGQRTKLGALIYNTNHASEEYGYLSVYLRLKGVVPPSSAGR